MKGIERPHELHALGKNKDGAVDSVGGFTRRELLGATVTAGVLAGSGVLGHLVQNGLGTRNAEPSPQNEQEPPSTQRDERVPERVPARERVPVGDTLDEQIEQGATITLDEGTLNAIRLKWRTRYGEHGSRHEDLRGAVDRMEPWKEAIEQAFKEEGVPREFAFLAIPESHFKVEARSSVGAVGPYQFMKETAKSEVAGLRVSASIDERYDPIESARACARLLKDNFSRLNKSWHLALSGYNGGFVWRYAKETPLNERTYGGFLAYMQERIQARLEEEHGDRRKLVNTRPFSDFIQNIEYPQKFIAILEALTDSPIESSIEALRYTHYIVEGSGRKSSEYKVQDGDTLFMIAKTFRTSTARIQEANGLQDHNVLVSGAKLSIPIDESLNESLEEIAQKARVPLDLLQACNPAIRNTEVPLPTGYAVRIPQWDEVSTKIS